MPIAKMKPIRSHERDYPPVSSPSESAFLDTGRTSELSSHTEAILDSSSYENRILRKDMRTWTAARRPELWAERRADYSAATTWHRNPQSGFASTNTNDERTSTNPDGSLRKYCVAFFLAGYAPKGQYCDPEVIITAINGEESTNKTIAVRYAEIQNSLEDRVPIGVTVGKEATVPNNGVRTFPCTLPDGLACAVLGYFVVTHLWPERVITQAASTVSIPCLKSTIGGEKCQGRELHANPIYKGNEPAKKRTKDIAARPVKTVHTKNKVVWMVRLEKLDLSQSSWWSDASQTHLEYPSLGQRNYDIKADERPCEACDKTCVQIFESSFVCLNMNCPQWWNIDGKPLIRETAPSLAYSTSFLKQRFNRADNTHPIKPLEKFYPRLYPSFQEFVAKQVPDPATSPMTIDNIDQRSLGLRAGFMCPQCGMANSRLHFHQWHCRNADCRDATGAINPFKFIATLPVVDAAFLKTVEKIPSRSLTRNLKNLPGFRAVIDLGTHLAYEVDLGNECGATILKPKAIAVAKADNLFKKFQIAANSGDLVLARRPMGSEGGTVLTNHFAANFGEPYALKFALENTPLDASPDVVQDALKTVNEYMEGYFADQMMESQFNEIYIAAYLSRAMGMTYHDDGEKGLGHIIATWTLGGQATFSFCIKPDLDFLPSKKGGKRPKILGDEVDVIIPGCTEEAFRRQLKQSYEDGSITKEQWKDQLMGHMEHHMAGSGKKNAYQRRPLFSFPVEHGDIVVMWGQNTQKYLEHKVLCASPLRFAITFRRVMADMATPAQWAKLNAQLAKDTTFRPSLSGAKPGKRMSKNDEQCRRKKTRLG